MLCRREGEGDGLRRLVLTTEEAAEVEAALCAATDFYQGARYEIWVEDRERAKRHGAALEAAGFEAQRDTVVLALAGSIAPAPLPAGVEVTTILDVESLRRWARVKLQGFGDSEDAPSADRLASEVEGRRAEWPFCRYLSASLYGEVVSVLGHYLGGDQMVFNLATRVPFRGRGIARALLACWALEAQHEGARSQLINCEAGSAPYLLYRRLGFTDEIYWYRAFASRE